MLQVMCLIHSIVLIVAVTSVLFQLVAIPIVAGDSWVIVYFMHFSDYDFRKGQFQSEIEARCW